MTEDEIIAFLERSFVARVGTCDGEGWPYVVPLLFLADGKTLWFHNTAFRGHLRQNIESNPKVCVEFDEPGEIFPSGPTQCETSVSYRSVIVFGRVRIVTAPEEKAAFYDGFMRKYAGASWGRPEQVYTRLDATTVYAVEIEKATGKKRAGDRWAGANGKVGGPATE